jgi:hypothetical membrane protein
VIVESLLRPGYDQYSQYISELGVGQNAILQNVNFWVFGLLVVAFAVGIQRGLPNARSAVAKVGTGLLVLFGAMVFLAGLFPDSPFPYPGQIHIAVSVVAFGAIIWAQLFVWVRLRQESQEGVWGRFRNYSLASGLLSLAIFFAFGQLGTSFAGLVQRISLAVGWLWIEVMALKLFRVSGQLSNW